MGADAYLPTFWPILVDAYAAASSPSVGVKAATLRKWEQRGKIHVEARDERGRSLYDLGEVMAVATRR